jgi:hypothetical protein
MGKADGYGILLCFSLAAAIELLLLISGNYGPSGKDRGNMAATDTDVEEVMSATMNAFNIKDEQ